MATPDPIVSLKGVSRAYRGRFAVDQASLTVSRGRILGLLGASGSGKSTLLRAISGLEPIDAGTISIEGQIVSAPGYTLAPEARNFGLVFQDFALFPHLTVSQNVGFGLKGRPDQSRVVAEMLNRVRLADRGAAFPHTLSGGEQQRVALARALARSPDVILLDEPFSSLDGSLRDEVRDDLVTALRDSGASALIVTHDAEDAMIMADDLALMDAGRIVQTGTPQELYDRPRSVAAARLLGPVNLVEAEVRQGMATSALGRSASDLPDGAAWMGVRPSNLTPTEPGAGLRARVASVGFSGAYWVVRADAGPHRLSVHFRGEKPPVPDDIIGVTADPAHLMVMPYLENIKTSGGCFLWPHPCP